MPSHPLYPRIHVLRDTHTSGRPRDAYTYPQLILSGLVTQLQVLPEPLVKVWLASPGGHIILNDQKHGFVSGANAYRQRNLLDVAWLKLSFVSEPVRFLTPISYLVTCIAGWERPAGTAPGLKGWESFERGVRSCFQAGYGISVQAQIEVHAYLAEGIAQYMVDRRNLNEHDPRLEKLLTATLFNPKAYS